MTIRLPVSILLLGAVQTFLVSCATGGSGVSGNEQFQLSQQEMARRLESQGHLAEALIHWQFVAATQTKGGAADLEITRLKGIVAARRAELDRKGEIAISKGQTKQAKVYFLQALSFDESDAEARGKLREIDLKELWKQQDEKNKNAKDTRDVEDER